MGSHRPHYWRGVALISAGTVLLATVPVFSKIVLLEMSTIHFSFFWMCFGLAYTAMFATVKGLRKSIMALRREWKYCIAAGISALVWVYLAFAGIKRLDPTVAAIFINMRGVWGVLIGLTILHERYSKRQYIGMSIILIGLLCNLIDSGGPDELLGSFMTFGAALAYVITNSIIKRFVTRNGIIPALFARFTLPALAFFLIGLPSGIPFDALSGNILTTLAVGSFVGPFMSFVLIFSSLKYLDLGVQTFFQSTGVFVTAILSYIVFSSVPSPLQITGGLIVIGGMVFMSIKRDTMRISFSSAKERE